MNELQLHTLLEQASRFRDEGKSLHAIQILMNVIAVHPSSHKAYVQLAQVYTEMNRPDYAEKILLKGAAANKENPEYTMLLGNLHLQQQHFEQALQYFDHLKHLNIPQIHQSIGLIYSYQKNLEAAEQEFRLAAAGDPDLPKVYELLGEVLLHRGDIEGAMQVIQRALRRDPYSAYAHKLMGEIHASRSLWENAFEEFCEAIDCDPDDYNLWHRCGEVLTQLERFTEAKVYLERACALNGESANILISLGRACLKLGESNKADEMLRAALTLEPSNIEAQRLKLQLDN